MSTSAGAVRLPLALVAMLPVLVNGFGKVLAHQTPAAVAGELARELTAVTPPALVGPVRETLQELVAAMGAPYDR